MKTSFFTGLLAAFILAGCTNTQVVQSWKEPTFTGTLSFKKIIVVAVTKEEATRRTAEDELAKFIGPKAVASHTLIPTGDIQSVEKVKAQVDGSGADGLVRVRAVDVREQVDYVPGPMAGPAYAPWGAAPYSWGWGYEPGYFTTNTVVRLETSIYSLPDEKLIWTSASETINPGKLKTEVQNLARAVKARLVKEKLLQ